MTGYDSVTTPFSSYASDGNGSATATSCICSKVCFVVLHLSFVISVFWTSLDHSASFPPPLFSPLVLSRIGFSSPTARQFFIGCCLPTISRFPQVNLRLTKKTPHNFLRHIRMHSGGFELTQLTHTRIEDNLIRHRGDWLIVLRCACQDSFRDHRGDSAQMKDTAVCEVHDTYGRGGSVTERG